MHWEYRIHTMTTDLKIEMTEQIEGVKQGLEKSLEKSMAQMAQKLEDSFKVLQNNVTASISENNKKVEDTVSASSDNVTKSLQKSFKDVLLGESNNKSDDISVAGVAGVVKDIVVQQRSIQVREDGEKEERHKNLIIRRIKEVAGASNEELKKNDMDTVKMILSEMGREEIEVRSVIRLGRFDQDLHSQGKSRAIKAFLNNKEERDSVMRNAYKLGQSNNEALKNAQICYDLTQEEQKTYQSTVQEAKDKTASQDKFFWKVRGPPWALRMTREIKRGYSQQN